MSKGLNLKSVKNENKSLILYLLNSCGSLSRKEIANKLSLTPAGVTKICAELIAQGLICEESAVIEEGRTGRREIPLSLSLKDKFIFGINSDRDKIAYFVAGLDGTLYEKQTVIFTTNVDLVIEQAKEFLYNISDKYNLIGAGVSIVGSLDDGDYSVWYDDNLHQKFESAFGMPVVIENNVKSFAQGELIYGNLKDKNSILFLKWGAGLGSSIVANGKIYSGNDSGVAEIGHYIVNTGGAKCRCGRFGCLETEVSINQIISEAGGNMSLEDIVNSNNTNVVNIIDHKIDLVALALTNTATILNTQNIVLFGAMFNNELIAQKLIKQCVRYNSNLREDMICVSSLNSKSDYIGTTAICAKKFFFEREV